MSFRCREYRNTGIPAALRGAGPAKARRPAGRRSLMSIGLDTPVVLRLLTGEPDSQGRMALEEVQTTMRGGGSVFVSDLVASEVCFALQHHYGTTKTEAIARLARFFKESGIKAPGAAATVLARPGLAAAHPGFVDRMIHAEYVRSVRHVLTFEKPAGRLPGVQVPREI